MPQTFRYSRVTIFGLLFGEDFETGHVFYLARSRFTRHSRQISEERWILVTAYDMPLRKPREEMSEHSSFDSANVILVNGRRFALCHSFVTGQGQYPAH